MSSGLLTPPNTTHKASTSRQKENCPPSSSSSRISFSTTNETHVLDFSASPAKSSNKRSPKHKSIQPSSIKSVLKPTEPLPPFPEPETREVTPEPHDPLVDASYLARHVQVLIQPNENASISVKGKEKEVLDTAKIQAVLKERIEAYCILAARIKTALSSTSDADSSWPLFHPLRHNASALSSAISRDLDYVFVDPLAGALESRPPLHVLPSPKQSPSKKGGMTESQVTYARDLCTVAHAAMRFLNVILPVPAVYRVFDDLQLSSVLTTVLSIPLTSTLPTPNARKTYALAISVLQMQKLPAHVLAPARDRIICAIKRGLNGELGREGKKGAVGDGLKAIHDLAAQSPPTFGEPLASALLSPILDKLLAPTLGLRASACMALTSVAWALVSAVPGSQVPLALSKQLSEAIIPRLLPFASASATSPAKSPTTSSSPTSSPTKLQRLKGKASPPKIMVTTMGPPSSPPKPKDPALLRTIRQTLASTDPSLPAAGPIWALSVLAGLIILLGPALYIDLAAPSNTIPANAAKAMRKLLTELLKEGLKHEKSAVRAMTLLVMRVVTWSYFYAVPSSSASSSSPGLALTIEQRAQSTKAHHEWNLPEHLVELGAGTATFGAILYTRGCAAALKFLGGAMVVRGSPGDAVALLRHFVCIGSSSSGNNTPSWDPSHLLPTPLLVYSPLLTTEWNNLSPVMKDAMAECTQASEIRTMSERELKTEAADKLFGEVWRVLASAVAGRPGGDGEQKASTESGEKDKLVEVADAWTFFVEAKFEVLKGDADAQQIFAEKAFDHILFVLRELRLPSSPKPSTSASTTTNSDNASPVTSPSSPTCTRITLVDALWDTFSTATPCKNIDIEDFRLRLAEALRIFQAQLVYAEEEQNANTNAISSGACAAVGAFAAKLLLSSPKLAESEGQWGWQARRGDEMSEAEGLVQGYWAVEYAGAGAAKERGACWRAFVNAWTEGGGSAAGSTSGGVWEVVPILLGVPFARFGGWDLSEDDLHIWKTTYKHLDYLLSDEGFDSGFVANHVSACISRVNLTDFLSPIPTLEVLLQSYVSGASHDTLPDIVFDLANDVLSACYPPEPRNKVQSLWPVRALEAAVGVLPSAYVEVCLSLVREALRLWIEDDAGVLTKEEYDYNIVPLYATLLLALEISINARSSPRATPSSSISTLESFADIIIAPFQSGPEDDKTILTRTLFEKFWTTNFGDVKKPENGWPEGVQACLEVLELSPAAEVVSRRAEEISAPIKIRGESPEVLEFPDDDEPVVAKESVPPIVPAPKFLGMQIAPRLVSATQPIAADDDEEIPETPERPFLFRPSTPPPRSRSRTQTPFCTPTRPSKLISAPAILQSLYFVSPESPLSSPMRRQRQRAMRPRTPSGPIPMMSANRTSNKENMSPIRSATVERSPFISASPSVLGKRRSFDNESEELETPLKASKKPKSSDDKPHDSPDSQSDRNEVENILSAAADVDSSPLAGRALNLVPSPIAQPQFFQPIPSAPIQPISAPASPPPAVLQPIAAQPSVVTTINDDGSGKTAPKQPESPTESDEGYMDRVIVVQRLKRTHSMMMDDQPAIVVSGSASAPPLKKKTKRATKKTIRRTKSAASVQDSKNAPPALRSPSSSSTSSSSTSSGSSSSAMSTPKSTKRQKPSVEKILTQASPVAVPSVGGRTPRISRTKKSHKYWVYISDSEDEDNDKEESSPSSERPASSDDDPRFGQVTPHHLVSPAPRRVARSSISSSKNDDPPSDDSQPPSSPVRTAVARKQSSLVRSASMTSTSST